MFHTEKNAKINFSNVYMCQVITRYLKRINIVNGVILCLERHLEFTVCYTILYYELHRCYMYMYLDY